jgi:hypothetical protein
MLLIINPDESSISQILANFDLNPILLWEIILK